MKITPEQIKKHLDYYACQNTEISGEGATLANMLTPPDQLSLRKGEEEVAYLAEFIASKLCNQPSPKWNLFSEKKPSHAGNYLTYWSDGAMETFPFSITDCEADQIFIGGEMLLFWAELPAAPTPTEDA